MSFETPHVVEQQGELKYAISEEFNITFRNLTKDKYEVTLNVVVTNKVESEIIFLIELKQIGIFLIQNFPQEKMTTLLNVLCPTLLFPDTRETISSMTVRGGFPPLYLKPIDFDALYKQKVEKDELSWDRK